MHSIARRIVHTEQGKKKIAEKITRVKGLYKPSYKLSKFFAKYCSQLMHDIIL